MICMAFGSSAVHIVITRRKAKDIRFSGCVIRIVQHNIKPRKSNDDVFPIGQSCHSYLAGMPVYHIAKNFNAEKVPAYEAVRVRLAEVYRITARKKTPKNG